MEFANKFFGLQDYELSQMQENIELVIYSLLCLGIPMALGHPQFLVGTLVNAALILAALNLRNYKMLPVILLPSIGVLMAGVLFGQFTMLLIFMIPFIWAGNGLLVFVFKYFFLHRKRNRWLSLAIAAVIKTVFLFSFAFMFYSWGTLPAIFLTSMGLFQLYTALAGGVLAMLIQMGKQRWIQQNRVL